MHPHPMVLYILNLKWMRWKEARRVQEAVAADRGRRAVLVLLSEEKIIQRCSAEFLRLPTNIPWAAVLSHSRPAARAPDQNRNPAAPGPGLGWLGGRGQGRPEPGPGGREGTVIMTMFQSESTYARV